MIQSDIDFLNKRKKYNKRIVAKYLALYTENSHKKKCLITLTPKDGKLQTTVKLRQEFLKKLNRYKNNLKDGDKSIQYFCNIEFTPMCIPHLHM